jgi:hypothetical protein
MCAGAVFPIIHRPYDYLLLSSSPLLKNTYEYGAHHELHTVDSPFSLCMWIARAALASVNRTPFPPTSVYRAHCRERRRTTY